MKITDNTPMSETTPTFWPADIEDMHTKFGVNKVVDTLTNEQLKTYLKFRLDMVQEEVTEAHAAFEAADADGIVDALIDDIVFVIGTLNVLGVDAYKAWNIVHAKNMEKSPGVKEGRPNPYGFPDLIKPAGWTAPSHLDNLGLLSKIFK
jgi:predicted HAD superfamily Cof-like phosphohydrolase